MKTQRSALAALEVSHSNLQNKEHKKTLSSFENVRLKVKTKIKEDLFRFRTCCADPRASK